MPVASSRKRFREGSVWGAFLGLANGERSLAGPGAYS